MQSEKNTNKVIKVDKEIKTISCPYINDSSWDSHPKIYLNFGKIVPSNVHIVEKLTKDNLKKVLIISPNWIGDSIMAEPLFSYLKKNMTVI